MLNFGRGKKDALTEEFFLAAQSRDFKLLEGLLEKGVKIDAKNEDKETLLHIACKKGDEGLVNFLIKNEADLEEETTYGQTPLMLASEKGNVAVMQLLIDGGVEIEATDGEERSALTIATENSKIEAIRLLLDSGADADHSSENGESILMAAAQNANLSAMQLLIDKGADPSYMDDDGWDAMMHAAYSGSKEAVALLISNGMDVDARDDDDNTNLMLLAREGSADAMKILIGLGADLDAQNLDGETALMLAATSDDGFEAVRLLLDEGADVKKENEYGENAYGLSEDILIARLLLTKTLMVDKKVSPQDAKFLELQLANLSTTLSDDDDAITEVLNRIMDYDNPSGPAGLNVVYCVLAELARLNEESIENLSAQLGKAEGNVRKALPTKALAYAYSKKLYPEINSFMKNSNNLLSSLSLFPIINELREEGILDDKQYDSIATSLNPEVQLSLQLEDKINETFEVSAKSKEAKEAIGDPEFLVDLFSLYSRYGTYGSKSVPLAILKNAVKIYFEEGIEGFKAFKMSKQMLADEQLGGAIKIREKLMKLDLLEASHSQKASFTSESLQNEITNYFSHSQALMSALKGAEAITAASLAQIAKSAKSPELAALLEARDIKRLTSASFDEQDERLKARGISCINLLSVRGSLADAAAIFSEAEQLSRRPKSEQETQMPLLAERVGRWISNKKGMEQLSTLKRFLLKDEAKKNLRISQEEMRIAENAIENAISAISSLKSYGKKTGSVTITARITFDPGKILTFGRYGSSGAGNCQISTGEANTNQALMSILCDSNQFLIHFEKGENHKTVGFAQLHLVASADHGMIFLMENSYTNEPDKSAAMKDAAHILAYKIKAETGLDCYAPGEGEEVLVEIPKSYVARYIDFLKTQIDDGMEKRRVPLTNLTVLSDLQR